MTSRSNVERSTLNAQRPTKCGLAVSEQRALNTEHPLRPRTFSHCRPFTLVEVLVALAVTAVIVPITLRALMLGTALDESAARHRQLVHLADLKLQELVVTGTWLNGDSSGTFGDDLTTYRWELATDTWTAVNVTMRRLDLTVFGPARHGESAITLTTLVPESTTQ